MGKLNNTNRANTMIVIGIGGPSSSGKTTVAKNLINLFKDSRILHQDDFYKPENQLPKDATTGELNWDHPDAIDFFKFKECIRLIKAEAFSPTTVDSLEPDANLSLTPDDIDDLRSKSEKLKNLKIVLVDGFLLFHDEELLSLFDLKLFYYSEYAVLKSRRLKRQYSTLEGVWVDPPNYFDNIVWPAYEQYHRGLFTNEDVNSELNDYAKQLGIRSYKNDDNTSLYAIIEWTLRQLSDYVQ